MVFSTKLVVIFLMLSVLGEWMNGFKESVGKGLESDVDSVSVIFQFEYVQF